MQYKITVLLVCLCCIQSVSLAQDNPNEQRFSVERFTQKMPSEAIDYSKHCFSFDMIMSNPLTANLLHPYTLDYRILSASGEELWRGTLPENIRARADFRNPDIAKQADISVDFLYANLNLPEGRHKLTIELSARNMSVEFGAFYTHEFIADIPKLYSYDEQEFRVSEFYVNTRARHHELDCIELSFACSYKFLVHQIKDLAQSALYSHYSFEVILKDSKTGAVVSFFDNAAAEQLLSPGSFFERIEFHVPYSTISLPEGNYELTAELHINRFNKSETFGQFAQQSFTHQQPALYLANFDMKYLRAVYKTYDATSVFGRAFSRATSDAGKGYPDTYWGIKIGSQWHYRSAFNRNSFKPPPGSTSFIITDSDPIWFFAYDYDFFSPDDLIGRYKIEHPAGSYRLQESNLAFADVETTDFTFEKMRFPYTVSSFASVQECRRQGVSGVCVNGFYEIPELPEGERVKISSLIPARSIKLSNDSLVHIPENLNLIMHGGRSENPQYFIPYYRVIPAQPVGFRLELANYRYKIEDIFTIEEISVPDIMDSKLQVAVAPGKMQVSDGIIGIEIKGQYDIPPAYRSAGKLHSKIEIIDSRTGGLLRDTILPANQLNEFSFIMAYAEFLEGGKYQTISILEEMYLNNGLKIGSNSAEFTFERPDLSQIEFEKAEIITGRKSDYKSLEIRILYSRQQIVSKEPGISGRKSRFDLQPASILCHPQDRIVLQIYDKDSFGTAMLIKELHFSANDFKKGSLKIRHPASGIKQLILKANVN